MCKKTRCLLLFQDILIHSWPRLLQLFKKVHTLTLVQSSLQQQLSSVPKVAVVWRFNCALIGEKISAPPN